jgi:16S rRNA (uracil1498-N3)-methyltransferase
MSGHRFFLTGPLAGDGEEYLALSEADLHHAVDVVRVGPGEVIDVVDADSCAWRFRVTKCALDGIVGVVLGAACSAEGARVTLFQGMAKGRKMDTIVRQAVEVGVEEIVPVVFARSVARVREDDAVRRVARFERIAEAAAKQSKRSRVPRIGGVVSSAEACRMLSEYDGAVMLWEGSDGPGIEEAIRGRQGEETKLRVALVVGPEGGMTSEEAIAFEGAGAVSASLGKGILRTETAAVVGLGLLVHALGGLGRSRE